MKRKKLDAQEKAITQQSSGKLDALPKSYPAFLEELKERIRTTQIKASLAVHRELIKLYWDTGKQIVDRQEHEGWGAGVIERLAKDIRTAFPGLQGFSARNIWHARAFYLAYTREVVNLKQPVSELDGQNLPQPVSEIPWGHNIILLQKLNDAAERLWYAKHVIEQGWSRAVLVHQIESGLFERQGKAITNFRRTLPASQSDLAQEAIKDPYTFDFLTLDADYRERELEKGLLDHVQRFLLELGVGFAFVGRQVHMEVGENDFYIDLLFYHLRLRCFVVIELKAIPFKPEFAGKMNFYLSAVDDKLRHNDDQPSIGIILCKSRDNLVAEYALKDTHKPIGVSIYKLTKSLPDKLKGTLPTIKELEAELTKKAPEVNEGKKRNE